MEIDALEELNRKRRAIRPLLSPGEPADALASYYALWHDPRRTLLTVHYDRRHLADGFIAVCQTGADLFRPLVTLRAANDEVAAELLDEALSPHRVYHVVVPVVYTLVVENHLEVTRSSLNCIHVLDPMRFEPILNVLVQRVAAADSAPRFQIESQGRLMAMSGTNWRSPFFAEVFVYVHPQGRGRGWGKSVVSACTTALLEERLRPLYLVEQNNQASIRIAEALGYVDTGHREFSAEGRSGRPSQT